MNPIRRAIAVVVAVFATLALVPTTTADAAGAAAPQHQAAAPQHKKAQHRKAPKPSYVALGDSYSAGSGALPPTDACLRSAAAFPILLAKLGRLDLTHAACGGATIPDVMGTQLGALNKSTDYVTVQAGGNDIGFVPVFTVCAGLDDAACMGALAQAHAYLNLNTTEGFRAHAGALYKAIRAKAPKAKLIVVGYPRLFNGTNCSTQVYYSPAEQTAMNATIDLLNKRLRQAAKSVGAKFADPTKAFKGHAWCDKKSWITPAEAQIAFHPTALGQALGLLPTVARKFL